MKNHANPTTKEACAKLRAADKCVCGHRRDRHGSFFGGVRRSYCRQGPCGCNKFRKARARKPPLCPLTPVPPCAPALVKKLNALEDERARKARAHAKEPNASCRNARILASFSLPEQLPSSLLAGSPVEATRITLMGEIKGALRSYSAAMLNFNDTDYDRLHGTEPTLRNAEAALAELLATALTKARP